MNAEETVTDEGLEYEMPVEEAIVAVTLALMTGYAQSSSLRQRQCLASRIEAHLAQLSQRFSRSSSFRQLMAQLRTHWCVLSEPLQAQSGPARQASDSRQAPVLH